MSEIAEILFDPFYQESDASVSDDEERDFILGYSLSQRLLLVVYAEREQRARVISARPAVLAERKLHEEA